MREVITRLINTEVFLSIVTVVLVAFAFIIRALEAILFGPLHDDHLFVEVGHAVKHFHRDVQFVEVSHSSRREERDCAQGNAGEKNLELFHHKYSL